MANGTNGEIWIDPSSSYAVYIALVEIQKVKIIIYPRVTNRYASRACWAGFVITVGMHVNWQDSGLTSLHFAAPSLLFASNSSQTSCFIPSSLSLSLSLSRERERERERERGRERPQTGVEILIIISNVLSGRPYQYDKIYKTEIIQLAWNHKYATVKC